MSIACTSLTLRLKRRSSPATDLFRDAQAHRRPVDFDGAPVLSEKKQGRTVDMPACFWYNYLRWFGSGEMAEWFKALVLKTSDAERHRGFESLSLRQFCNLEKYPRGRRGSPAKGVGWDNCREGSNPSFSAMNRPEDISSSGLLFSSVLFLPAKRMRDRPVSFGLQWTWAQGGRGNRRMISPQLPAPRRRMRYGFFNVKTNSEPLPGLLLTEISPPINSTTSLAMERPNPVPVVRMRERSAL